MQINDQHQAERQGLIISYFGNSVAVEAANGQVFQCHLRRNQPLPVVGDRVRWTLGENNTGVILQIEPRKSLLARGDGRGNQKALAANVDIILIVMSPPPIFAEYLIDRYLVAAELLQIKPVIVLNKIDLLNEKNKTEVNEQLAVYQGLYPVIFTSIYQSDSIKNLATFIGDKTAVLVGPSGVGKSSIITALNQEQKIRVGEVSPKGAGKHTTTATRLYHLPNGGALIDSPGVREFNLWPVDANTLLAGFKEFHAFLGACKFRDCVHVAEPGCSIRSAVEQGKIRAERYQSYQGFMREVVKK